MTPEQKEAYESGYLSGFHNKYDCPYPKIQMKKNGGVLDIVMVWMIIPEL